MLNIKLISLMLLAFINVVGIAMPYPILSPLILGVELPQLFNFSPMMTAMFVLSLYPLGQFLAAPIMGAYSDRIGPRKVVTLSMSFTALGYLSSAYSLYQRDIVLFCLTRFITGLSEGNFAVLRAELGRLPLTATNRVKLFGYFNLSLIHI